ncbi:hypothetical protein [Gloeocapsa sp. PCC 73106]|uniref:hypothetical protein n=1 Tax=Gloeocapsa sp. PCC 73106 TaxID=102232 RepID=UPI0002AB9BF5|nr:hypothetical protein [Gloeocapsa sp. PCC 73106]ELR97892.1 hypothetical protein GLO73106DRAFT_00017100 [Gloeocapsa sp. PCC 73106]
MAEQHLDQLTLINEIETLLIYYSFEVKENNYHDLIDRWMNSYPLQWIRLALLEALYLGRYKSLSIEQILAVWTKKGNYTLRFNHDFESLICRNLPQNLSQSTQISKSEARRQTPSSIHQFQPKLSASDFFLKLKAVSQSTLENESFRSRI